MAVHFIRHATSLYNVANTEWNETHTAEDLKVIKWQERFIDSPLAPVGVEQAKRAREAVSRLEVDLVVVSPLRRALETCELLFGDRGVPIRVCGLFTEQCCNSPDVSAFLDQPFGQYSHFDWSELLGKDVYWPLDIVQNDITAQIRSETATKSQAQARLLEAMRTMQPAYVESTENLNQRIAVARNYLRRELNAGKRVAVVTHSYFLRALQVQLQGAGRIVENCEVLSFHTL